MAETMLLRMPAALLLGALLGWAARRHVADPTRALFGVAALVLASCVMPFWMLPVLMDRAEAVPLLRIARDGSLAAAAAASVICFSAWAPVLRQLWVLEQIGMLVRFAVWYGLAPVALCTAWDAGAQQAVGQGLLAAALVLGGAWALRCWRARPPARAPQAAYAPSMATLRSAVDLDLPSAAEPLDGVLRAGAPELPDAKLPTPLRT